MAAATAVETSIESCLLYKPAAGVAGEADIISIFFKNSVESKKSRKKFCKKNLKD